MVERISLAPRGGADFRKWLKDIELRYSDAFAEVGSGALADLKKLIDGCLLYTSDAADE